MDKDDLYYMRHALSLARKGQGKTSPNPMVGAFIIQQAKVIGTGFHAGPGHPHAEIVALSNAGYRVGRPPLQGGTLYTNLEPCCHTEKRTPPCTEPIIKSGLSRVVVAMEDPNPLVHGKGIQTLRDAGITVETNVLKQSAVQLNEAFVKYMTTQKPFVIMKAGMTLDGRMATPTGESQWITGEKSRAEAKKLRSHVDAILVGIGTVLADNPGLLANRKGFKNPLRVVMDPDLILPLSSQLVTSIDKAATLVCTLLPPSSPQAERLKQHGVQILSFLGEAEIPWSLLLEALGKMNIQSLLIEGGGDVHGRALRSGIVDKVIFYIAPRLLCGNDAKAVVDGTAFRSLEETLLIRHLKTRKIGDDLCIEGYCTAFPPKGTP